MAILTPATASAVSILPPPKPIRVCLYLRKSPAYGKRAKEKEEISLEYQEETLRAWCEEQGWVVVGVRKESHPRYVLKARPVLMQVVRECAAGHYDLVLCYDITRLTADSDDLGWLAVELRDSGAALKLRYGDPGDTKYARVIRALQADGSGDEVERLRQRTADGKRKRMEDKHLPLARPAPYGMVWNHIADPASAPLANQRFQYLLPKGDATAEVARRCLTEVATGATSAGALVRTLNEEGVPAPQGGVWTRAGLAVVLHNPAYCSLEITGRTRRRLAGLGYDQRWVRERQDRGAWTLLEVKHRPLVSIDVWEQAQAAMAGRTVRGPGGPGSLAARCLMRGGLATCAGCERPLWTHGRYRVLREEPGGAEAGVEVTYYACASQHSVSRDAIAAGRERPCTAPATIRADHLDTEVWRKILEAEPPPPPDAVRVADAAAARERARKKNARDQARQRRLLQEGERRALLQADAYRRAALEAVNEGTAAALRQLEAEADRLTASERETVAEGDRRAAYLHAVVAYKLGLQLARPWATDASRDADMQALVRALGVRAVVTRPEAGARTGRRKGARADRVRVTLGVLERGAGIPGASTSTRGGLPTRNTQGPADPLTAALARFSPGALPLRL